MVVTTKPIPFLSTAIIFVGVFLSILEKETLANVCYALGGLTLIYSSIAFFKSISAIRSKTMITKDAVKTRFKLVSEHPDGKTIIHNVSKATSWELIREESDVATFRTGITLSSFGELVSINLEGDILEITSGSLDDRAMYDWGKNQKNIEAVRSLIVSRQAS